MRKKIAFVSTMAGYPWGGSEYLWADIAKQALLEGNEVFLSIYDWSITHPLIVDLQKLGAYLLPRPRFFKPPSLHTKICRRLNQAIPFYKTSSLKSHYQPVFDYKPDVICISQGGSYDTVYLPELLNLVNSSSIPYTIISQLNADTFALDSNTRACAQQLFNQATHVAFVSHHNLKLAERQLATSLPNAVVVQNPVNLVDRSIIAFPPQSIVSFACVARLEAVCKCQDVLLEVLSSSTWKQRNWQCCFYGSGPDLVYLEALAQHYCIADRVKFMGHISDVKSIWANNHILILPSRAEGTPLALVEAMLCGRPAIVTNVGGNTEWIHEAQTGFIAEAPMAESLSMALERAWQVKDNWQQMGIRAHEYAVAKFEPSSSQKLLNMILNTSQKNLPRYSGVMDIPTQVGATNL